jgi:DNA repair protein RadD
MWLEAGMARFELLKNEANKETLGRLRSEMAGIYRQAHWQIIPELLQNADDEGATEVAFFLAKDTLVVVNDGTAFTDEDVKGVIGAFHKNKAGRDKIGRFGIGFKSVFAHAKVVDFVSGIDAESGEVRGGRLPRDKTQDEDDRPLTGDELMWACGLVGRSPAEFRKRGALFVLHLSDERDQLGERTARAKLKEAFERRLVRPQVLLFVRHLRRVSWHIDGVPCGSIAREDGTSSVYEKCRCSELLLSVRGHAPDATLWYWRFEPRGDAATGVRQVAVAFQLDDACSGVVPVPQQDRWLYAWFATRESMGTCGLLVHGNFALTETRENLSEKEENAAHNALVLSHAAGLLRDVLVVLAGNKRVCLPLPVLAALPFPEPRHDDTVITVNKAGAAAVLGETVVRLLLSNAWVPTRAGVGGFAACGLVPPEPDTAEAELMELFTDAHLAVLLGMNTCWLHPDLRRPEYEALAKNLTRYCGLKRPSAVELAVRMSSLGLSGFPASGRVTWLGKWFHLLSRLEGLTSRELGRLADCRMLPAIDEQGKAYLARANDPDLRLAPDGPPEAPTKGLAYLDPGVLTWSGARDWFRRCFSLREPELRDRVLARVVVEMGTPRPVPVGDRVALDGLRAMFLDLLRSIPECGSDELAQLAEKWWVPARPGMKGPAMLMRPRDCVLPSREEGFVAYCHNNKELWVVDVSSIGIAEESWLDKRQELFRGNQPRNLLTKSELGCSVRPQILELAADYGQQRTREALAALGNPEVTTYPAGNPRAVQVVDLALPGCAAFLSSCERLTREQRLSGALYLWSCLLDWCRGGSRCLQSEVRFFCKQARHGYISSPLQALLGQHPWVPVQSGEFKVPRACIVDELDPGLKREETLLRDLGIASLRLEALDREEKKALEALLTEQFRVRLKEPGFVANLLRAAGGGPASCSAPSGAQMESEPRRAEPVLPDELPRASEGAPTEEDQALAAACLCKWLTRETLLALMCEALGGLGGVGPSDGGGLSQALVDVLGGDLLATEHGVRQELVKERLARMASDYDWGAKATAVFPGPRAPDVADFNRRWDPASRWARWLTWMLGLPSTFAGQLREPRAPGEGVVERFLKPGELRGYQTTLVAEVKRRLCQSTPGSAGENRALVVVPTGAGKTRIAVEALLDWRERQGAAPKGILWIAHSEELCEQAMATLTEHHCIRCLIGTGGAGGTLGFRRVYGGRGLPTRWGVDGGVGGPLVMATFQTLMGASLEQLASLQTVVGVVVLDEVHRANAPRWRDPVLKLLGIQNWNERSALPLLGLTATPEGINGLEEYLGRAIAVPAFQGQHPILVLADEGVLARPVRHLVRYETQPVVLEPADIEDLDGGEPASRKWGLDLAGQANRRRAIADAIEGHLGETGAKGRVLAFASCVPEVHALKWELEKRGRPVASVTGRVSGGARAKVLQRFKGGEINVLINYGVLTTGFDEPGITAVVIARPTASDVLYTQMVGRGLRGPAFKGTPECHVFDIDDALADNEGNGITLARDRFWDRLGGSG